MSECSFCVLYYSGNYYTKRPGLDLEKKVSAPSGSKITVFEHFLRREKSEFKNCFCIYKTSYFNVCNIHITSVEETYLNLVGTASNCIHIL